MNRREFLETSAALIASGLVGKLIAAEPKAEIPSEPLPKVEGRSAFTADFLTFVNQEDKPTEILIHSLSGHRVEFKEIKAPSAYAGPRMLPKMDASTKLIEIPCAELKEIPKLWMVTFKNVKVESKDGPISLYDFRKAIRPHKRVWEDNGYLTSCFVHLPFPFHPLMSLPDILFAGHGNEIINVPDPVDLELDVTGNYISFICSEAYWAYDPDPIQITSELNYGAVRNMREESGRL